MVDPAGNAVPKTPQGAAIAATTYLLATQPPESDPRAEIHRMVLRGLGIVGAALQTSATPKPAATTMEPPPERSARRHESSPRRRETSPRRPETSPRRREASPRRREASPRRRGTSPRRRGVSPGHRETSPRRHADSTQETRAQTLRDKITQSTVDRNRARRGEDRLPTAQQVVDRSRER